VGILFREKSRGRSRHRSFEKAIKRGILFLLVGGIAVAIYLLVAGLPR